MSKKSKGSVRMGPISIFSLIILLSLAVLAVLAVTTAQANYASAEKHSLFTADTYANETEAQALLADIDGQLYAIRDKNYSQKEILEELERILPDEAWVEDGTIRAEFVKDSGRTLRITLEINSNAKYTITQWQASTSWNASSGSDDTLWSGGTENG